MTKTQVTTASAPTVWPEPESTPGQHARGHLPVLDGVRGLAILLVMVHHQTVMGATTAFDRVFLRLTDLGWCGVDLFFVLSGFLITGILYDTKGEANYFRNFYARRVLRIFPLYYAFLLFVFVILPRLPELEQLLAPRPLPRDENEAMYWFYLSNVLFAYRNEFHPLLGVSWSLAIEEQFYLLWPLIVWSIPRTKLLWVTGLLIVVALALRGAMVSAGVPPIPTYVLLITRFDALAVGGFVALALRGERGSTGIRRASVVIGALAALIVFVLWYRDTDNKRWLDPPMQTWGYTAIALLFGCVLVRALTASPRQWLPRILSHALLRVFGKYSYALYLVHLPMQMAVDRWFFHPSPVPAYFGSQVPSQLAYFAAASGASLVVAWLCWHLLEKHFLKLKRRF